MRLRRLLVLGIPACGSTTPKEEAPREPPIALPAPERPRVPPPDAAVAIFDPQQYVIDEVPQSICGRRTQLHMRLQRSYVAYVGERYPPTNLGRIELNS